MNKLIMTLSLAAVALGAFAARPIKIELTDEKSPADDKAYLEVFLPQKGEIKGAVVVCPGGSYGMKAIDKEGRDWAAWMAERGIATAVLDYRLPHERHNVPLADCTAAIDLLRTNSSKWKIPADKIGVMGFSAGGHLASTMATHYTETSRPDFQILMYPVITMDPSFTHDWTHHNLIGQHPRPGMEDLYSNEKQVTPQTPPAFIFATEDDGVVPVANSIRYYEALTSNKVPSELHIYPYGGHGYGKLPEFQYVDQMLYLLDSWIKTTVLK